MVFSLLFLSLHLISQLMPPPLLSLSPLIRTFRVSLSLPLFPLPSPLLHSLCHLTSIPDPSPLNHARLRSLTPTCESLLLSISPLSDEGARRLHGSIPLSPLPLPPTLISAAVSFSLVNRSSVSLTLSVPSAW
jgi:hypothetical protein